MLSTKTILGEAPIYLSQVPVERYIWVVTHDGAIHMDELLATAMLACSDHLVGVIRTREPVTLDLHDYIGKLVVYVIDMPMVDLSFRWGRDVAPYIRGRTPEVEVIHMDHHHAQNCPSTAVQMAEHLTARAQAYRSWGQYLVELPWLADVDIFDRLGPQAARSIGCERLVAPDLLKGWGDFGTLDPQGGLIRVLARGIYHWHDEYTRDVKQIAMWRKKLALVKDAVFKRMEGFDVDVCMIGPMVIVCSDDDPSPEYQRALEHEIQLIGEAAGVTVTASAIVGWTRWTCWSKSGPVPVLPGERWRHAGGFLSKGDIINREVLINLLEWHGGKSHVGNSQGETS